MSTKKVFSPEEIATLRANPYTERVTAEQISFTLAFKKEFWRLSIEGCTGNIAFRKLGYDPEVLGFERVHNITNREFEAHGPRSILLTDITYIPLGGAHCFL